MRTIIVNESNINLKYVYFYIVLIDGVTAALNEDGSQPQIQINGTGWQTNDIGVFQNLGFGNYRALLSDNSISAVGNIILTHYETLSTLDSRGEDIEVIANKNIIDTDNSFPLLSYVTIEEAEDYFSKRLNSEIWTEALLKDKNKSLCMATTDIDCLNFRGAKTNSDQLLEFPRNGLTVVNKAIKLACCEIAHNHLDGIIIEDELRNMNISNSNFANVSTSYSSITAHECFAAGINSFIAWKYLKPFLMDALSIRLERA